MKGEIDERVQPKRFFEIFRSSWRCTIFRDEGRVGDVRDGE